MLSWRYVKSLRYYNVCVRLSITNRSTRNLGINYSVERPSQKLQCIKKTRRHFSVECQLPACQQSVLQSEQLWICLGAWGPCTERSSSWTNLNMSGGMDVPVQWGPSWTSLNSSGWDCRDPRPCGHRMTDRYTHDWKHYLPTT